MTLKPFWSVATIDQIVLGHKLVLCTSACQHQQEAPDLQTDMTPVLVKTDMMLVLVQMDMTPALVKRMSHPCLSKQHITCLPKQMSHPCLSKPVLCHVHVQTDVTPVLVRMQGSQAFGGPQGACASMMVL